MIADVAATLNTPLTTVLAMEWTEVLRWWREASRIEQARRGR